MDDRQGPTTASATELKLMWLSTLSVIIKRASTYILSVAPTSCTGRYFKCGAYLMYWMIWTR